MKTVDEKYLPIIKGVINEIRHELDRLYWKYQKEMNSPFDNTGNEYKNNTFTVRAYYWGDDEKSELPNLEYPGINIYWYKYSCRGLEAYTENDLTLDFLTNMLNDCLASLRKDFGEIGE